MSDAVGYKILGGINFEPFNLLLQYLNERVVGVRFGADFAMATVIADDGVEAIETYLTENDLPAVAVYEETHISQPVGIGGYIGGNGNKRAEQYRVGITFDIWARDTREREVIAGILSRFIFEHKWGGLPSIGIIDIMDKGTRTRGFDLTDRILQFHSHQLTNIFRRLMSFDALMEFAVQVSEPGGIIEVINLDLSDTESGVSYGTLKIGEEQIPYSILKRMRQKWSG